MEKLLFILAFVVILIVIHFIFRKKAEENLEEFEKFEKEIKEKKKENKSA